MAVLKAPPKQPKTTVVQLRLDDEAKTESREIRRVSRLLTVVRRDGGTETRLQQGQGVPVLAFRTTQQKLMNQPRRENRSNWN